MTTSNLTILFALALALSTSTAFTATSRCQRLHVGLHGKQHRSLNILNSTPDPEMPSDDMEASYDPSVDPSMSIPDPPEYVPPAPTRNSPPAVRQKRMDPLMASLTRDDSGASPDGPTQTVPFLGEIPADGTMLLLAPAVAFAILGFGFSFVIAFNSADKIVDSIAQTGESIAQTAQNRNNRVYDKNVCRGLCSSQEKDIDGMRNFMEFITAGAREKQAQGSIAIEEPVSPVVQQLQQSVPEPAPIQETPSPETSAVAEL